MNICSKCNGNRLCSECDDEVIKPIPQHDMCGSVAVKVGAQLMGALSKRIWVGSGEDLPPPVVNS